MSSLTVSCPVTTTTTTTTTTTEAPVTTTTTTTTTTAAASTAWTVRYSTDLGDLCSQPTQTVYTAAGEVIEPDTFVFTDAGLTSALLGYNFIVSILDNIIYNIDLATGQIQLPTGGNC